MLPWPHSVREAKPPMAATEDSDARDGVGQRREVTVIVGPVFWGRCNYPLNLRGDE